MPQPRRRIPPPCGRQMALPLRPKWPLPPPKWSTPPCTCWPKMPLCDQRRWRGDRLGGWRRHGVSRRCRRSQPRPMAPRPKAGFSGECVRSAQLLLCDDAEHDPRVDPDVCRQLGIRSILAAPILHAGRVAGIVELFSERPRAFTAQHAERLANLAAEAATVAFGEPMALSAAVTAPLAGIAQPWPGVRPAKAGRPIPAATAAVAQSVAAAPAVAASVTATPSVATPPAASPASAATANAARAEVTVPHEPVTRATGLWSRRPSQRLPRFHPDLNRHKPLSSRQLNGLSRHKRRR